MSVNHTITFVCDRCGSKSPYEMKRVSFSLFSMTLEYDLCVDCMEDFEKWLKSEVE